MRLFISHISEEAEVAKLLKKMLKEDFHEHVNVFVSSDVTSVGAGDEWLVAIREEINRASAVIVLCSSTSLKRPWVQFELGAAWMRGIPIIPVCHSGLKITELQLPLSLKEGLELGAVQGLERLYVRIASELKMDDPPSHRDVEARRRQVQELEKNFQRNESQKFGRYFDIVVPAPGRLRDPVIPDSALIASDTESLNLFGFLSGGDGRLTWKDLVAAAKTKPDTRWIEQLQECVYRVSNNMMFMPVQAVYHTNRGSFQPQLAKRESLGNGDWSFHVHLVETVVAPLFEVDNDFHKLATMLRLGLRFRFEVIEQFRRLTIQKSPHRETLAQLKHAMSVIKSDALSRGAQGIDRCAVIDLFESTHDQSEISEILEALHVHRALMFRVDPEIDPDELRVAIDALRSLNVSFMELGTRRLHHMVRTRWAKDGSRRPTNSALASKNGQGQICGDA
ncbi:toll/interleukin-1 receptor domain-containing protein [Variovorax sp. dw_954]|uniref:toll/interleukin-1 receptor domain-containing protein n=1 Tax=Variovorax sp. dw_954 TaxID=2720078 RepID=UPI001BD3F6D4|nr:toll/interleukin-1 receptor domain-containing protein [Variovorax sp. dw_954]